MIQTKWWWGFKQIKQWVTKNNPHEEGTVAYYDFNIEQYGEAAKQLNRRADMLGLMSAIIFVFALLLLIAAFLGAGG